MAIDTGAKRQGALLEPCGTLTPDGTIGAPDRQYLLGAYYLAPTSTGGPTIVTVFGGSDGVRSSGGNDGVRKFGGKA